MADVILYHTFFLVSDTKTKNVSSLIKKFTFISNQKGGKNLICNGYEYRVKKIHKNSMNLVCAKSTYTKGKIPCPARCVFYQKLNAVKAGMNAHNHYPDSESKLRNDIRQYK